MVSKQHVIIGAVMASWQVSGTGGEEYEEVE